MPRHEPITDETILEILHLVENEGLTYARAGAQLGLSRNKVAGIMNRIRAAERELGWKDAATKPENRDGGMPPRWWARDRRDAA